jgi:hypothetical protein
MIQEPLNQEYYTTSVLQSLIGLVKDSRTTDSDFSIICWYAAADSQ